MKQTIFIILLFIVHHGNAMEKEQKFVLENSVSTPSFGIQTNTSNFLKFDRMPLFTSMENPVKSYGEGKSAIWKSAVLPGWGMVNASGDKRWFAATPICYGLIGYGLFNTVRAKSLYNDYLNTYDQDEMDDFYARASRKKGSAYFCIAAGVGAYVMQLGVTILHGYMNDYYRNRNSNWQTSTSNWSFSPGYNMQHRTVDINLTLKI